MISATLAPRRCLSPAAFIDLLLPRSCVLCGGTGAGQNLCSGCRDDLPRTLHACTLCALPLGHGSDPVCGPCLLRPPAWHQAIAGLVYRFPVDRLVCRLKFNRDISCLDSLALELLEAVRLGGQDLPEALVPVPLHRTRLFARNFNQADLLARRVAGPLGIRVCSRALARTRRTPAQSGLDATERKRNIRGAFACYRRGSEWLRGRHVAIVDDVLTTGATLAECSRTLKRAGAARISVWVAARAPAARTGA